MAYPVTTQYIEQRPNIPQEQLIVAVYVEDIAKEEPDIFEPADICKWCYYYSWRNSGDCLYSGKCPDNVYFVLPCRGG